LVPADLIPPPLVRTFMPTKKIGKLHLIANAKSMTLGGIKKSDPGKIEQTRPSLAIIPDDVGNGDLFVWIGPKKTLKYLERVCRFDANGLHHGCGGKLPHSYAGHVRPARS